MPVFRQAQEVNFAFSSLSLLSVNDRHSLLRSKKITLFYQRFLVYSIDYPNTTRNQEIYQLHSSSVIQVSPQ